MSASAPGIELAFERIATPIGDMLLAARDGILVAADFADCRDRMDGLLARRFGRWRRRPARAISTAATYLNAYFAGDLTAIDEIQLAPGGTVLQGEIWRALREIPCGTTLAYGALAARLGRAGAARAVGRQNGLNPIAVVIPCHRLVGANGRLTGYAGGIARKRWLLAHEGAGQ